MNIVLINPPHTAIGSRVPDDHLPPLGLLALGGPLIEAGHKSGWSMPNSGRCRWKRWCAMRSAASPIAS